ncbi:hypothetical protein Pint_14028 [Pistacia integerrima]|uniref:Uncharacterized protein n=1 Tax=Pistacia integerrima TaxID=434235 RepID=A0ACC0Y8A6_9ROSI|nr:hypothetical protein Pint_14028 [Pistacia integerrima]
MKPQKFNFKFNLFGIYCEIRNVDLDYFNYIVLIKEMKKCVAKENEEVNLFPNEKFRVEAMLHMSGEIYLLNSDDDVAFIFQQYRLKGVVGIKLFVEAFLPALPEPNTNLEPIDEQPQIPKKYDVNGDGNVRGDVDGEENVSGEVDGKDNVIGDKGEKDGADSGGILSDYEHNSEEEAENGDDDNVGRMSRRMKRNELKYEDNGKIYFKVG